MNKKEKWELYFIVLLFNAAAYFLFQQSPLVFVICNTIIMVLLAYIVSGYNTKVIDILEEIKSERPKK